jgi:hypothetical protein
MTNYPFAEQLKDWIIKAEQILIIHLNPNTTLKILLKGAIK